MVKWMKKPIAKRGDRILEENRKKKKYESKIELEDYVTRDKHGHIRKIHIVDYLDNLTRERLDLILEKDEYYRNRIKCLEMELRIREEELQTSQRIIAEFEDKRLKERMDDDVYKPSKRSMRLI